MKIGQRLEIRNTGRLHGRPRRLPNPARHRPLRAEWLEDRALLAGDFAFIDTMGSTGLDLARSVATDAVGNAYITGEFRGTVDFDPGAGTFTLVSASSGAPDVFIAKYSPIGALVWAQKNRGTNIDWGNDVALDPSGNVWVVGSFSGTVDFNPGPGIANITDVGDLGGFVLKLDSAGNFLWAGNIDSLDGERLESLAIDSSGNVFVAGQFNGTGDFDPGPGTFNLTSRVNGATPTFDAFLTKIDSTGTFLWAKAWGGNALSFNGDSARDVAVDGTGKPYVATTFLGSADLDPGPGVRTVTAPSNSVENVAISKFDVDGNLTWGRAFIGNSFTFLGGIAVDAAGSVYTTGGVQSATDFDPGPGVANLAAASGIIDAFVSKLDTNGIYQWAIEFGNVTNSNVEGAGIAVDDNGDVYTTGHLNLTGAPDFDPGPNVFSMASAGSNDIYVSRLDSGGRFISARRMGGTGNDQANAVALNLTTDEIYIAGQFTGTADFDPGPGVVNRTAPSAIFTDDIFLSKLRQNEISGRAWNDLNGNGLQDAGEPAMGDVLVELVISHNGGVIDADDRVIGTLATAADGSYRFTTPHQSTYYLRFLPPTLDNVGYQFTVFGAGPSDVLDSDVLPALGRTGFYVQAPGIPVAHVSAGLIEVPSDVAFAFGVGGGGNQQGRAVATDAAGNVYVAGKASGATLDLDPGPGIAAVPIRGGDDAFLAKYNAAGQFVWGRSYGGSANDSLEALEIDADGNLLAAGFFASTVVFGPAPNQTLTAGGVRDAFVTKIDPDGNLLWIRQVGGTGDDAAFGVSADAGGVYVTGHVSGNVNFNPPSGPTTPGAGGTDIFVLKLAPTGLFQWAARAGGTVTDQGFDLQVHGGSVYATGKFGSTADFNPDPSLSHNLTTAGGDDIFLWQLDAVTGGLVSASRTGSSQPDQGTGLAIDAEGNLLRSGEFQGTVDFDPGPGTVSLTTSLRGVFVTKSDAAGNLLWARAVTGSGAVLPGKIAVAADGQSWTSGSYLGTVDFDPSTAVLNRTSSGLADIFVWSLDADGALVETFTTGGLGSDLGTGVVVPPSGSRVATTGSFEQSVDFDLGTGLLILSSLPTAGTVTTQDAFVWVLGLNAVPTNVLVSNSTIAENAATGAVVGNLSVVDPDPGDTHTLLLVDSADGRFAIVGNQLVVADGSPLDFESAASHIVVVRATDAAGAYVDIGLSIQVTNVNEGPLVTLGADAAVNEGDLFAAAGLFSDPDDPDTWAATVDYGDGSGPQPLTLNPDKTFSLSRVFADNGSFVVTVVVTDAGNLTASDTLTVVVANVAPQNVQIAASASGVRGQPQDFAGSFTDPGTADTHTVSWDFGDGTGLPQQPSTTAGASLPTHVFVASGIYTVTYTVRDDDGDQTTASFQVTIADAAVQPDPCDSSALAWVIGGTAAGDKIIVQGASDGSVTVMFNGQSLGSLSGLARVIVYGQASDDDIHVVGAVALDAWLFGGAGNDRLQGGAGDDVVLGQAGDDQLFGGQGRDLLAGGTGVDRLIGNAEDDIILAGDLVYADLEAALCDIMDEWTSAHSFNQRVQNLTAGQDPGRANGNTLLTKGVTVVEDGQADRLTGTSGDDWFFYDPELDIATDQSADEFDWLL